MAGIPQEELRPPKRTCMWSSFCGEFQAPLLGLRGVLALQTFLWAFCSTFVPDTLIFGANMARGAGFSVFLGRGLSVLFWNPYLISTATIILSGRMVPVSYLQKPTRQSLAGPIFRRSIRLGLPTTVALVMIYGISSGTDNFQFLADFAEQSGIHLQRPYEFPNTLAFVNGVFDVFWMQTDFAAQAANMAFPTQTLWIISLVYSQSYTVYMTQLIVPYTRTAWRIKMLLTFIVLAWWVQSWAWYSLTGLLLADLSINTQFKEHTARGLRFKRLKLPIWIMFCLIIVIGLLLQFLWVDWKPQYQWYEIYGHSGNYQKVKSPTQANELAAGKPTARLDAYLVVLGLLLIVETTDWVQWALSWRPLVELGRRSFSIFLMASIISWTASIQIWLRLHSNGWSKGASSSVTFFIYLMLTAIGQEMFYWLVDKTSRYIGYVVWASACS